MAELREFIERNRTRKLSLRGKILLLNTKGMAKFWYLATIIPMHKWFLKPKTEKLVFEFLWSGFKDPIKTGNCLFTNRMRWLRLTKPRYTTTGFETKIPPKYNKPPM